MVLQNLEVQGLRGFRRAEDIPLAVPNGNRSSGLTILVGPNNGGKSTVVDAFRAHSYPVNEGESQSFPEGRRNKDAGDKISIQAIAVSGKVTGLRTVADGGSETQWHPAQSDEDLFVLPSRRYFDPYFYETSTATRDQYRRYFGQRSSRGEPLESFGQRLFQIQKNRAAFNNELGKVVKPIPKWAIDQSDEGQYYLKVETGGLYHSSEGMGEGLVSLLIIDALYDSAPGSIVVIDEPELSLHPSLQRRLFSLLRDYAKDRQIVIATHSPYFADFGALLEGARLSRIHRKDNGSTVSSISSSTVKRLGGFLRDRYNPHVLGLNAREAFFLEDRVILVEGQEDVILYQSVAEQVGVEIEGDFFGWGVGGAEKMGAIAALLQELGFEKVVGLLDEDKESRREKLQETFPSYRFHTIPAKDIRTKPERRAQPAVEGLLDESGKVRSEYEAPIKELLTKVNGEL